jgi:hypothetical protein
MKSAILRATVLATAMVGMLGVAISPAQAASTSIASIKQCDAGGCGSAIRTDGTGIGHDSIQIATSSISKGLLESLNWIRVSARDNTSGAFTCLAQWNTSSTSARSLTWDTTKIPTQSSSGCPGTNDSFNNPSNYGHFTNNGGFQLQVQVDSSSGTSASSPISIKLNNSPTPPVWVGSPSVSGAAQRAPVVTLKWTASPEPDVQEYRFFRTDPSGTTKQYPVSASSPGAQGCSLNGGTYTCYDTDFPSTGFGGSYSYALGVWRSSPSPADTCYYPNQQSPCIGAQSSDVKQVSITEPAPPTPSPTGGSGVGGGGGSGSGGVVGGGPGSVPTGVPSISTRDPQQPQRRTNVLGQTMSPGDCFTCGTYKETLPYGQLPADNGQPQPLPGNNQQRPVLAAGSGLSTGSSGPDPRQLWVSIAAGLVLLLTAGHVARVLRVTAH